MVVPIRRPSGPSRTEILPWCKCFLGRLVHAMENPTGDSTRPNGQQDQLLKHQPAGIPPPVGPPPYQPPPHGAPPKFQTHPGALDRYGTRLLPLPLGAPSSVSDTESLWWLSPAFGMASITWTITTGQHWRVGINRFEERFSWPNRCHASSPVVAALRQYTPACVSPRGTSRHPGPMTAYGSGYRCRRL